MHATILLSDPVTWQTVACGLIAAWLVHTAFRLLLSRSHAPRWPSAAPGHVVRQPQATARTSAAAAPHTVLACRVPSSDHACRCFELPDAVFTDVVRALSASEWRSMRLVCLDWCASTNRSMEQLQPARLHMDKVLRRFPYLTSLDLCACGPDIVPRQLRKLSRLRHLRELTLGCGQRTVVPQLTDRCLPELLQLTGLTQLNLAQCVHVGDAGMMALMQLTRLRALNLSGCIAVTDVGLMMLSQLPCLDHLELAWCLKLTNAGLQAVCQGNTRLRHLNISGCQLLTDAGMSSLTSLINLQHLNLLNLGYTKPCVTDAVVSQLSRLSAFNSLSIGGMQLATARVSDAGVCALTQHFPGLTHLTLLSLDVSDVAVTELTRLTALRSLHVRGTTKVTHDSVQHLARLSLLTELNLLHNLGLSWSDGQVQRLRGALSGLQSVALGNHRLSQGLDDAGLLQLTRCSCRRNLHSLTLASFAGSLLEPSPAAMPPADASPVIGNDGGAAAHAHNAVPSQVPAAEQAPAVAPQSGVVAAAPSGAAPEPLQRLSELQHWDLTGAAGLEDDSLQHLHHTGQLQSLHLSRCTKLTSAGLQHLCDLSHLQSLSLSHCAQVEDEGMVHLSPLTTITQLLLSGCHNITDHGLRHLSNLACLKVLDVSCNNRLTGTAFEAFGRCRRLSMLNLSCCSQLTDSGVAAVSSSLPSLTMLYLMQCSLITDAGVSSLHRLKLLTGIDLSSCPLVSDAMFGTLVRLPSITTLKLNGCARGTDAGVAQLTQLTGLLTVHLDKWPQLSDAGLRRLAKATSLTSLRFSHCPTVTDAGVAALTSLSRLSTLSLTGCSRVTEGGVVQVLSSLTTLASLEY